MPRRPGSASPAQLNLAPLPQVYLARRCTRAHLAERIRSNQWEQVRPGAYVDTIPGEDPYARLRRHAIARICALVEQSSGHPTVCLVSAALLFGLPLLDMRPKTHLVQRSHPTRHGAPDVARHFLRLPAEHRTQRHGLPVTTLERTVVDCAQALPPLAALVIADAAFHIGADPDMCTEILASRPRQHGVVQAREILALADAGSESPGETTLRFTLLRDGFPVPETQIRISTPLGSFWSDLGWRGHRLLCEYDGRTKYGAAGSATEAVISEKRRQDAVEESGWRMLRVVREDFRSTSLLKRVHRWMPDVALHPRPILNAP